ncbi:MAG: hypothetical protein ABSF59_13935 [Candidatus Sulfotelmatobacter sp.]|jgi:hypothetical protein
METLTRLVTDSLARHGFDRPPDPRRLQWSRWSRCDSPDSLLVVPSKPGIFALAEEVMSLGASSDHGETAALGCPERSSVVLAAEAPARRMLAVLQFAEDDDMAFVLDRMFTKANPLRARLATGGCFLRFVVIEDQGQRRSICSALNQWLLSAAEKASPMAGFSSSMEVNTDTFAASNPDHGANKNLHCPKPIPSGF